MSGNRSRSKGRNGETEALLVLEERGFVVVDTTSGKACEDIFATDPNGTMWAVEVKNRKAIDIAAFEKQAREQARKRGAKVRWLVMARLEGYPRTFVVCRQGELPSIWRGGGA